MFVIGVRDGFDGFGFDGFDYAGSSATGGRGES